jgi:hypothetical protein
MDPLLIPCPVCRAQVGQQCTPVRWVTVVNVTHELRRKRADSIADALVATFADEIDQWEGTP